MRVLTINGSPKGKKSNTYQLTRSFIEGMKEGDGSIEECEIMVDELNIRPCAGCFSCWSKTPGTCWLRDDMAQMLERLLWADVTIWSFPLYFFSVPGPLKTLMDRQLPLMLPFMESDGGQTGSGGHPSRYDMSGKRTVVISTCGFYRAEGNYESVRSLFDRLCGRDGYTALFCGQGELFGVPEVKKRTDEYLGWVRRAGEEYVEGAIRPATREMLDQLLFPREVFERWADSSWGVNRETGERESEALVFTRGMAALYDEGSWSGHDLVVEMAYTDVDETYQLVLRRTGCEVRTDGLAEATTRIETPLSVWRAIAQGDISGSEALIEHRYRVSGDFDLLMHWDSHFKAIDDIAARTSAGAEPVGGDSASSQGRTSFAVLLTPWIVLWSLLPVDPFWGSLASLAACALVPLVFYRRRKTVYDVLTGALVAAFAMAMLLGAPLRIVIPLSYLCFGIMWTATCFGAVPLTANYSMNEHGGEKALANPLFVKTNRILTAVWGVLYLLTPLWTYLILDSGVQGWVGAINAVLLLPMGIFTAWFQRWYPARVARG